MADLHASLWQQEVVAARLSWATQAAAHALDLGRPDVAYCILTDPVINDAHSRVIDEWRPGNPLDYALGHIRAHSAESGEPQ